MTKLELDIMNKLEYATFVKIISDIPSCIFFKDTELKYLFSSHCWAQLISDDIVGKTDLEIRKDKENALKAMEADREILRTGKGTNYVIKSDIDGDISYLQLIKEPIFDDDGKVIGIVGLINDITEKTLTDQKLEESNNMLKDALEELKKKNAAQKLFTASMNHELRNPLNGIIGLLGLLMEDESLGDAQHQRVFNAYQSAEFILSIVNELLDFAKMETEEFKIMSEVFSLDAMVANIDYMARSQAEQKNLHFNIVYNKLNRMLRGDEKRIRQVINNLVTNAIKYTSEGFVKLTVDYKEDILTIICEDSGQGMSESAIKSLFDPYVRFNEKSNKSIQGTGLGMSIVKKIIEKMNGEIDVLSKEKEGTTMTVRIPLCEYSIDNLNTSLMCAADEVDYSELSVLCVDDIDINLMVFAAVLEGEGVQVDKADSGKRAIELADKNRYDIIFMDHMMPQMDGVEAMKLIKSESAMNKDTPIVMLTGNDSEHGEEFYKEAGAIGYLLKPAKKDEILDMIEEIYERIN